MQKRSRNILIRATTLVALCVVFGLWSWSYRRPLGVSHAGSSFWVIDSDHGRITLGRLSKNEYFLVVTLWPKSGWSVFADTCFEADMTTLLDAWLAKHFLGFAIGWQRNPPHADKEWVLSGDGSVSPTRRVGAGDVADKRWVLNDDGSVNLDASDVVPDPTTSPSDFTPFRLSATPPAPSQLQFGVTIPWWFIAVMLSTLTIWIWRKTRPQRVGFAVVLPVQS